MSEFTLSKSISQDMEEHAQKNPNRPFLSFEFFPPKTENGVTSLKKVIQQLLEYDPLFLDFTWGAGGSTSALTFDLCQMVKEEFGANPNMHLTCTNMDAQLIVSALDKCKEAGITNILALRGDPPVGQERWTASDVDFACAADLVKYIKKNYGDYFNIAVAGYPEGHPNAMVTLEASELSTLSESELLRCSKDTRTEGEGENAKEVPVIHVCRDESFEKELAYLKSKIEAGAKLIVTQMFFDVEIYGRFVSACRQAGITVPIIPGIMCISNYGGFKRMIKFCKTRVAEEILQKMEELKEDVEAIKNYGIEVGIAMCRRLQELGAPGFHFYTLNTAAVTVAIVEGLGYEKVKEVVQKVREEIAV